MGKQDSVNAYKKDAAEQPMSIRSIVGLLLGPYIWVVLQHVITDYLSLGWMTLIPLHPAMGLWMLILWVSPMCASLLHLYMWRFGQWLLCLGNWLSWQLEDERTMCPNCICSIIPSNTLETQQCSIPLNLPKRSLLADVNPSGCRSFGRSLLPWLGAITNEHMIRHLPLTLATTAESKSHGHTTKVPRLSCRGGFRQWNCFRLLVDWTRGSLCHSKYLLLFLDKHLWFCRNSNTRNGQTSSFYTGWYLPYLIHSLIYLNRLVWFMGPRARYVLQCRGIVFLIVSIIVNLVSCVVSKVLHACSHQHIRWSHCA